MRSSPSKQPDLSASGWQQRYDAKQTGWDRGEASPALSYWIESGDLVPGRILVPGCGRGHEVVQMARQGFEVTAVDFARSPLQELTRRLTEQGLVANVVRESVLHFATDQPFDLIYEQTCLCAIDRKHWKAYERMLFRSLKPSGKLFALFMQTNNPEGPPFHCSIDSMRELFASSNWRWPDKPFVVEHPSGMHELAAVLQKIN